MNEAIVYIKLPVYVQQFLRQRYCKGGADSTEPINLNHELHPAGILLYRKIFSNTNFKQLTSLCLSQQCYGLRDWINRTSPDSMPEELQKLAKILSSVRDVRFYTPFLLQPEHSFHGRLIPCDYTAQLNMKDAQEFRDIIFKEFWNDYDSFRTEWDSHPEMRGNAKLEEQSAIIEYMMRRDIDLDHEDALARAIRRRKHNGNATITCSINKYK